MRMASPTTTRVVLLAGLLAWVLGQWATLKHQIEVIHVRCAEHGEVIEVVADADAAVHSDVAQISAPDDEDHEHGCDVLPLSEAKSQAVKLTSLLASPVHIAPMAGTPAAPRGPPLAYAPKTSPPLS
ncbi:MAG: hypothetical protein ACI8RZ_002794 [Myxococcota bacterium]|jgi:hypothetical protein